MIIKVIVIFKMKMYNFFYICNSSKYFAYESIKVEIKKLVILREILYSDIFFLTKNILNIP